MVQFGTPVDDRMRGKALWGRLRPVEASEALVRLRGCAVAGMAWVKLCMRAREVPKNSAG